MRRYKVETLVEGTVKYYFIRDCETLDIVYFPSKYLKYKIKSHRSPNTVKRAAFAICYYLEYLKEIPMEIPQVYELDLEKQNDHFVNFLYWLKAGNHTEKNNLKVIHNGTCNAYLEDVFRFFLYIEGMDEQLGSLKVLSYNYHFAVNAVGVKKKLRFQAFKGYLQPEERNVRPALYRLLYVEADSITLYFLEISDCSSERPLFSYQHFKGGTHHERLLEHHPTHLFRCGRLAGVFPWRL